MSATSDASEGKTAMRISSLSVAPEPEPNQPKEKKPMGKQKPRNENKWPKNLFKRGDSWVLDFFYRGERYTENLGPISRTVAQERRDKRKGDIAAGELAVNHKL